MFENVTKDIKFLAPVVCWGGVGVSVVCGLGLMFSGAVILGLVFLFYGSLIAWVSSLCLYGFGQLIENSDTIVRNMVRYEGVKQETSDNSQNNGNPNETASDQNNGVKKAEKFHEECPATSVDTTSNLEDFYESIGNVKSSKEIEQKWNASELKDKPELKSITKLIEEAVYLERFYGHSQENIRQIQESIRKILSSAE